MMPAIGHRRPRTSASLLDQVTPVREIALNSARSRDGPFVRGRIAGMPAHHILLPLAQSGSATVRYDLFSVDLDTLYWIIGLAILLFLGLLAILIAVLVYRKRRRK